MLYDPITGLKTLGLEKVQKTVSALKTGAWYNVEWIHETVDFPELGGRLIVTTNTVKRFKINRANTPAVKIAESIRKCKSTADLVAVQNDINALSESQKNSIPNSSWNLLETKKTTVAAGKPIYESEKKPITKVKDSKYPFLTLSKNGNILLDCHKANVKDVRTGEYRKSTFKYYWVTGGTVRELASDAAVISNPKTVATMARHKYSGGTDLVTPSVNKIVRIHKTYAE